MTSTSPASGHGAALLADPLLNKGTAFGRAERRELGLHGLLPPHDGDPRGAGDRAPTRRSARYDKPTSSGTSTCGSCRTPTRRCSTACSPGNLDEMLPIVYTPTVGDGCQRFSRDLPQAARPVPEPIRDRDGIERDPRQPALRPQVEVIVVTDGERILGLGDQGAGGMGIPIGKLALYTACGGIHPGDARCRSCSTSAPTTSERLADPLYIGWRHERVRGDEYDDFVEELRHGGDATLAARAAAVGGLRPGATPARLLDRYRDRLCTFNDDIQGTAAVAPARCSPPRRSPARPLAEQRIVIFGAGSAGDGVADMLRTRMVEEGLTEPEAADRFCFVDVDGLLLRCSHRPDDPSSGSSPSHDAAVADWGLPRPPIWREVVARGDADGADRAVHGARARSPRRSCGTWRRHCDRPVIFPLSNPTSHAEADPADLTRWTDGRALIATGSPFPPLKLDGREVPVAQANNVYIFPAVGLAVAACRARRVTDRMMVAAARAVGECAVRAGSDGATPLLPPLAGMRDAAREIALAVAEAAVEDGVAPEATEAELRDAISATQWTPRYAS